MSLILAFTSHSFIRDIQYWPCTVVIFSTLPHSKNLFLLYLLIKKKSAVYSADRCNFSEPETYCSRNGNNLYKSWVEVALNSGPFWLFRFANHHFNWQILIKVWTSVIGLPCLIRTILENDKVRQIWTLLLGFLRRAKILQGAKRFRHNPIFFNSKKRIFSRFFSRRGFVW